MAVSFFHLFRQRRGLIATLRVGLSALGRPGEPLTALPTPPLVETVKAPSAALVADAVLWAGGDPKSYENTLPPWMFAYWGMPLFARLLANAPYAALKVINGGCTLRVNEPLPSGQPLNLSAHIVDVREETTKVRLHLKLTTGTDAVPDAQVVDMFMVMPRSPPPGTKRPKRKHRAKPMVDSTWNEVAEFNNAGNAGREFAQLTGDFNPIHWIPLAARAGGFKSCILHGFGTVARALENVAQNRWAHGMDGLAVLDVRFTSPLVLPGTARVFMGPPDADNPHRKGIAVGKALGGRAYLIGHVETR
jgi:hypothetical protein